MIVTVLLFLLDAVPSPKAAQLLIVNSSSTDTTEEIEALVKKHTKSSTVKSRNLTKQGLDMVVEFKCAQNEDVSLLKELHSLPHITSVSILSHDGERRF